jgi:hypothetical protein
MTKVKSVSDQVVVAIVLRTWTGGRDRETTTVAELPNSLFSVLTGILKAVIFQTCMYARNRQGSSTYTLFTWWCGTSWGMLVRRSSTTTTTTAASAIFCGNGSHHQERQPDVSLVLDQRFSIWRNSRVPFLGTLPMETKAAEYHAIATAPAANIYNQKHTHTCPTNFYSKKLVAKNSVTTRLCLFSVRLPFIQNIHIHHTRHNSLSTLSLHIGYSGFSKTHTRHNFRVRSQSLAGRPG